MSTRCTIHFHYGDEEHSDAIIYRHSDGYPDGVLPDLERFFTEVQSQTTDTRFNDPTYLAAKYVVWEAAQHQAVTRSVGATAVGGPLDFIGVGVTQEDPGDIEYRYHVHCNTNFVSGGERPKVTWEQA